VRTDFVLRSELRDFQTEYRGSQNPSVVIGVTAQLVVVASGRIASSRTFTIEEPVAGASIAQVFTAFEDATNRVLADIVAWAIVSGDAAWSMQRDK
jgi:cholesterol transport system auxiliary component